MKKNQESIEVDENELPYLTRHFEELKSGKFQNLALNSGNATARDSSEQEGE